MAINLSLMMDYLPTAQGCDHTHTQVAFKALSEISVLLKRC